MTNTNFQYWGKRDEKLNLPLNSSLSGTLNQQDMKTITTVMASRDFQEDILWLNGK
jgi:diphosphomevalonate decarboxylase